MLKIKLRESKEIFSNYFKPFVITDEVVDLRITLRDSEAAKNLKFALDRTDFVFHLDITKGKDGRKEYTISTVIDTKVADWEKKEEYLAKQISHLKDILNPLGYNVSLDARQVYQKMQQHAGQDFQDEYGQGSDNSLNEIFNQFKKKLLNEDLLPGGIADDVDDSEFDKDLLDDAEKHEGEHTKNKKIAKEIAKDHLKEDPKYYKKIEKVLKEQLENNNFDELVLKTLNDHSKFDWKFKNHRNRVGEHHPAGSDFIAIIDDNSYIIFNLFQSEVFRGKRSYTYGIELIKNRSITGTRNKEWFNEEQFIRDILPKIDNFVSQLILSKR